ncbi:plasmid recombination protein [Treponema sp. OttesenSCG-928-L16]|nr:plasmid recombination protein [Treponema sp. OttesenSCG-928-L16]
MQILHTEFYENVGKKYGLERGTFGSRTPHSDLKKYKEWEQAQKESLKQAEYDLHGQLMKMKVDEHNFRQMEKDLKSKIVEIEKHQQHIAKKEQEYRILDEETAKLSLAIPVPPLMMGEQNRINWRDSVQRKVDAAIKSMVVKYESLKEKIQELVKTCNMLKEDRNQWKQRAYMAEKDLATKPLEEIQVDRQRRQSLDRNQSSRKRGGFSQR